MNMRIVVEHLKKLVRNSEYSKSDDFKELPVFVKFSVSFKKIRVFSG